MELNICKLLQFDQRVGSNLSATSGHWAAQGSLAGICDRNLTEKGWKLGDFPGRAQLQRYNSANSCRNKMTALVTIPPRSCCKSANRMVVLCTIAPLEMASLVSRLPARRLPV